MNLQIGQTVTARWVPSAIRKDQLPHEAPAATAKQSHVSATGQVVAIKGDIITLSCEHGARCDVARNWITEE